MLCIGTFFCDWVFWGDLFFCFATLWCFCWDISNPDICRIVLGYFGWSCQQKIKVCSCSSRLGVFHQFYTVKSFGLEVLPWILDPKAFLWLKKSSPRILIILFIHNIFHLFSQFVTNCTKTNYTRRNIWQQEVNWEQKAYD